MLSSTQRASGAPNRGISSPSFHGSGTSRTSHLQGWKTGGERPQPFQRGADMLCPLSNKGTRISHTSVSPGAPRVLRTPASPPHARLHFAHRGLRSSLQAVLGHRAPFCAVEEIVLPHTPRRYIKWAEPKYGASSGPDIYPAPRRRRPKTGLRNGSTWRTPLCRIQFGSASRSSAMLP